MKINEAVSKAQEILCHHSFGVSKGRAGLWDGRRDNKFLTVGQWCRRCRCHQASEIAPEIHDMPYWHTDLSEVADIVAGFFSSVGRGEDEVSQEVNFQVIIRDVVTPAVQPCQNLWK